MNCPKCGFELEDGATECTQCDWKAEITEEKAENENNVVVNETTEATENVEENSTETVEAPAGESVVTGSEDLVVDFDNTNNDEPKQKKTRMWPTVIISFIAGVLATLLTIGCVNGSIMNVFDKMTQGSPEESIVAYCQNFYSSQNSKKLVKVMSPYLRSQILSSLQSYSDMIDCDLDIEVTDDSKFEKVMDAYFKLVNQQYSTRPVIKNVKVSNVEYYKSGSSEYEDMAKTYKDYADTKNVSLFAKANFDLTYYVQPLESETTTAATTTVKDAKASTKKAAATTSTAATTTVASTTSEVYTESYSVSCVKINDTWMVFTNPESNSAS